MKSIFDIDEQGYIYDNLLRERARDIRFENVCSGRVYPLSIRPTLLLRIEDGRHVQRHIHEGAWTIGLHEEDLPGFEPDSLLTGRI